MKKAVVVSKAATYDVTRSWMQLRAATLHLPSVRVWPAGPQIRASFDGVQEGDAVVVRLVN